MPNTDPSEELGRLALAELRELRKLLIGNGSVGLFEQVRLNEGEIKRLWKACDKLAKAADGNRETGKIFWAKVTAICGGIAGVIEVVARLLQ